MRKPLVLIRGGGDLGSGAAHALAARGVGVIVAELARPTMVRRKVSFGSAVYGGEVEVEGIKGVLCPSAKEAFIAAHAGHVAVIVDPACAGIDHFRPPVLVDAILAKRNLGTKISDAPVVIGIGPGFTAGVDCHAVVESLRGPGLGKVLLRGAAALNTGRPASVSGHTRDRVLRAPCEGVFEPALDIGDAVRAGVVVGRIRPVRAGRAAGQTVRPVDVAARIQGVLRGVIAGGVIVGAGQKIGDIDPSGTSERCFYMSDKALTIGDGVIEAIARLAPGFLEKAWPVSAGRAGVGRGGIDYLRRRWPRSAGAGMR